MSLSMREPWPLPWRLHDPVLRDAGLPDFAAWCRAHRGARCRLWLSSAWLHELVCDPALPLRDDAAVLAWARPLLQHYHGDAALAWPLAAWQQGRQRGVSALHGITLEALQAMAGDAGVQLAAVRPWWSRQLQLALRGHRALRGARAQLLLVEGQRLTAIVLQRGQLTHLELRRLDSSDALGAWCHDRTLPTLALGDGRSRDRGWLAGVPA